MKKVLFSVLTLSAMCIVLSGCAQNIQAQDGYKVVSSESCDFLFEVPEDWNINYTESMLSANNTIDNANVTAFAFDTKEEILADDYFEQYKIEFEKTFSTMNIKEKLETKLSGVIARHVFYTVDMGLDSFNCQTVICAMNNRIYMVTFTASADTYENHTGEFEKILSSFRFS
jgi:hypothetical protein